MNVVVGDWIRFQYGGRIVIGKVEYIMPNKWSNELYVYTDVGVIPAESILEKRSIPPIEKLPAREPNIVKRP